MIVKVRLWHPEAQGFTGKDYCYHTHLPVTINGKVVAPTRSNPMQAGVVTQTDVDPSTLSLSLLYHLNEVTDFWRGELPQ